MSGINATKLDIKENKKNLEILELEAAQIPTRLKDVDLAVINGNYAIDAGLKVADALAVESKDGDAATAYVNVVAVKEGNEKQRSHPGTGQGSGIRHPSVITSTTPMAVLSSPCSKNISIHTKILRITTEDFFRPQGSLM